MLLGVTALGLLRLAVWATGSAQIHPEVLRGPEVHRWQVADPAFGGLSALVMAPDGGSLLAGGDRGIHAEAPLRRDARGRIAGIGPTRLTPVALASGLPPTRFKKDLEALTRDPAGGVVQGFEGFVRIERLARPGARPEPTHPWDRFASLFGNRAFEALATLPDGRIMAIAEARNSPETAASVILDGSRWRAGPNLPVEGGFAITGADVGPDGCLYLVERRYRLASGFTFRLRRLSGGPGAWRADLLYASAPASLGNVEAVSAWRSAEGDTVLSLLSDNGFLPFTPTRLIEIRTAPAAGCALTF